MSWVQCRADLGGNMCNPSTNSMDDIIASLKSAVHGLKRQVAHRLRHENYIACRSAPTRNVKHQHTWAPCTFQKVAGYILVRAQHHASGSSQYISLEDGYTRYTLGQCMETEAARGFVVATTPRAAVEAARPVLMMHWPGNVAMLKVLVSGKGFADVKGDILAAPFLTAVAATDLMCRQQRSVLFCSKV